MEIHQFITRTRKILELDEFLSLLLRKIQDQIRWLISKSTSISSASSSTLSSSLTMHFKDQTRSRSPPTVLAIHSRPPDDWRKIRCGEVEVEEATPVGHFGGSVKRPSRVKEMIMKTLSEEFARNSSLSTATVPDDRVLPEIDPKRSPSNGNWSSGKIGNWLN